jgi:hypothetical protein
VSSRCKNSPPKKRKRKNNEIQKPTFKNLRISQINKKFTLIGKPKFLKISQFFWTEKMDTPCNKVCYNEIDYHEVFFFPGKILPFLGKEIGEILVFLE